MPIHRLSSILGISLSAVLCLMSTTACKAQPASPQHVPAKPLNIIAPTDKSIVYTGRVSTSRGGYARYTYPGVQIRCNFTGTGIDMLMKPGSGYYMVEIDSITPYKVLSSEEDSLVLLAHGLEPGEHSICVTSINEGVKNRPEFHGFVLDEGAKAGRRPVLPQRRLEFIGNSITCGLGNEAESPKTEATPDVQNWYFSYDAIAARELKAQCMVVARSGIGVYRNCLGKPTGDKDVMPDLYPYVTFGSTGEKWDFTTYTPDVVCIGLGTNDTTNPSYDTELLYQGFMRLYADVRGYYPKAKIIFLTGTMLKKDSKRLRDLCGALNRLQRDVRAKGDKEVYRLDFTPADGSLGYGSGYHPSLRQHQLMAKELTALIRKVTGWK